ncbi:MAG TPA: PqqD family peptide modification chaperone [Solirubrobacteraceae bacterium]
MLVRSERAYLRHDGEDTFLVEPGSRSQLRLNPVAASIAEHLGAPITREQLHARLLAQFDVPAEQCAEDADRFVDQLAELGLVEAREEPATDTAARRRYLDLLKRTLVNLVYAEDALRLDLALSGELPGDPLEDARLLRDVRYRRPAAHGDLVAAKRDGTLSVFGARLSHTMIGLSGLDNLERCASKVFADGVPGDFLEAGVCHGGGSIFLRALQVAYGEEDRVTWVADSFGGVPPPEHPVDRAHELDLTEQRHPWMAAGLEAVRDNFATYQLLSDSVRFLPGLFADTLPSAPVERLAILRLDGDLYGSTRDTLTALYDRVAPGGFVIVDDYGALAPCRQAVDEFLVERGLEVELHPVDWTRVCWRKTE